MTKATPPPRRTSVERNIYQRPDGKYEIGYRDSSSRQRWEVVQGGIKAARALRDSKLGAKASGEIVRPNPRLTFGAAADKWMAHQVTGLRPNSQRAYKIALDTHLRPRWAKRRMDRMSVGDAAKLVRELREEGKSEHTIAGVLRAASRVFKFAARHMAYNGPNIVAMLDSGERPKLARAKRRRIFTGDELAQTIAAAGTSWRPLFALAGTTGLRLGECLGLHWADVHLTDEDGPWVHVAWQVDRWGNRVALKTEESRREVPIPQAVAAMLLEHKAASPHKRADSYVFATRSGKPLGQRNVTRELVRAMRAAADDEGRPTFPVLHERDEAGKHVRAPKGAIPTFHGFRHTVASQAINDDERAEEVAWLLGHANANVTRSVYIHEIKDADTRRRRRARSEARHGSLVEAVERNRAQQTAKRDNNNVSDLQARKGAAQ